MLSLPGLSELPFAYGLGMSGGPGGLIPRVPNRKDSFIWKKELGSQVQAKKNRMESEGRGNFEYSVLSAFQCPLDHPMQSRELFLEFTSVKRKFKETKKKNSNETLVRSGKQKATLFVRVCASRDEGNLLDLRRPLERGTDRLTFQLQMRSWGVETWGSLCTRRSALRKSYLNKLNSSREDRT